jgi:hypothetical protein
VPEVPAARDTGEAMQFAVINGLRPGKSKFLAEDPKAGVVVSALAQGVLDPADVGQAVSRLMQQSRQNACGALATPSLPMDSSASAVESASPCVQRSAAKWPSLRHGKIAVTMDVRGRTDHYPSGSGRAGRARDSASSRTGRSCSRWICRRT